MNDPNKDVLETAAEVMSRMRILIKSGVYISKVGAWATCGTCGEVKELRFGHCFECAKKADPEGGDPAPTR